MWKSLSLSALLVAVPVLAGATVAPEPQPPIPMRIVGRTKVAEQYGLASWSYQWPGVYFEARFKGAVITLDFDDSANNFNVIIDGKPYMELKKPGASVVNIVLARDWTNSATLQTMHTIRLEKRSETQYAVGAFNGFFVPKGTDALPAPSAPARQIEFIGDSYTVGYGNTSAFTQCTPDDIFETTDAQEGFPALVGRHFDADYQNNAFSGLGMVRNYDGHEHPKYRMPMLYPRAIYDDPTPASQPDWHPQIIVIGIGGNDFSTPLHDDEPWKTRDALVADYEAAFVTFVKTVRAANPGAFIILDAPDTNRAEYHDAVTAVFNTLKAGGETHIDELILPQTDNTGCNGHPNVRDDQKVADMLDAYIEAHPDLWQGK